MRKVISIQGHQAVGKTTLLRSLAVDYPDFFISYENPSPTVKKRNSLKLDINTEKGFIENQRLFINAEIKRYQALPDKGLCLFDRGPEDTECYTINYPKLLGMDWDIESALKDELGRLRTCHVDNILFLTADFEELQRRKEADVARGRQSFNLNQFIVNEAWYKEKDNVDFLDISKLSRKDSLKLVRKWLLKRTGY